MRFCHSPTRTHVRHSDSCLRLLPRETVVTLDLLEPLDLLVPQDPLDHPDLSEDLEAVERL